MDNEKHPGLGLNWAQDRVRAFHAKAGHPIGTEPTALRAPRLASRISWMREEIDELEIADDLIDQVDAIADLMYFALGTLVEMGVDGEPYFDIVHRANMRKLVEGGAIVRETDGKIQKPANWVTPETEMAKTLTSSESNFELVLAGPTDSGAACLAMVAGAAGLGEWDLSRFASELPKPAFPDGTPRLSPGALVAEATSSIMPFTDDFVPIEVIDEGSFPDVLSDALAIYPGVLVGIKLGQAYRSTDSRLRYVVVVRVTGNRVVILDPGPDHAGIQSINVDDLYAATKSALDGVHRLAVRR